MLEEKEGKERKGRRGFETSSLIEMVNGFPGPEGNRSEPGQLCHSHPSSECPHADPRNRTVQAQSTTCLMSKAT